MRRQKISDGRWAIGEEAGSCQLLLEEMQKLPREAEQADKIAQSLDTTRAAGFIETKEQARRGRVAGMYQDSPASIVFTPISHIMSPTILVPGRVVYAPDINPFVGRRNISDQQRCGHGVRSECVLTLQRRDRGSRIPRRFKVM
ncbi:hypothetical protein TI39_contig5941g00001 [Zymoseptoria brevis]|uniref:Uncharacterized protein n=1 Tax=Zymoseptoria brevis TaxID=1047168 RepID=A0A0F4G3Y5_9PEZI|nr:hypothetical protein TI39_contig5941g00001 [Zymoseptoria brevis]